MKVERWNFTSLQKESYKLLYFVFIHLWEGLPDWTVATVTDGCGGLTKVECWHIKQLRPARLNSAPLCHSSFTALPVAPWYHTLSANFYTESKNQQWNYWRSNSCWGHDVLARQVLSFFFLSASLFCLSGIVPSATAGTGCVG